MSVTEEISGAGDIGRTSPHAVPLKEELKEVNTFAIMEADKPADISSEISELSEKAIKCFIDNKTCTRGLRRDQLKTKVVSQTEQRVAKFVLEASAALQTEEVVPEKYSRFDRFLIMLKIKKPEITYSKVKAFKENTGETRKRRIFNRFVGLFVCGAHKEEKLF